MKHSLKTAELDVVVIGGGPAGLSAALTLGRCRRSVLVCDSGTPRNWASKKMHGFLSRDGICPREFRRLAREELRRYSSVSLWDTKVTDAAKDGVQFTVTTDGGKKVRCRKLLIATGLFDALPKVKGIEELFGKSVFQCPYCDGWETQDEPIAVYAKGKRGLEMSRAMTAWTRDIILFTNGPSGLSSDEKKHLARNEIAIERHPIAALEDRDGKLESIRLENGKRVPRTALFFDTACFQQSSLAARLGCSFTKKGGIQCGKYEATNVPGVFAAGNVIKDVHLAIVAAAEGAKAATGINKALTREGFS